MKSISNLLFAIKYALLFLPLVICLAFVMMSLSLAYVSAKLTNVIFRIMK